MKNLFKLVSLIAFFVLYSALPPLSGGTEDKTAGYDNNIQKLATIDTLPPVVTFEGTCGEYEVRFTELRDANEGYHKQKDSGVYKKPALTDSSNNFDEPYFNPPFIPYPFNYDAGFKLNVTDKTQDARAVFVVIDRAGNETATEITYTADKIELNPGFVDFDTATVNSYKDFLTLVKNMGSSKVKILSIELKSGTVFSFIDKPVMPFEVTGGEFLPLNLRYSPTAESFSVLQYDIDSIIVTTECGRFSFPVIGSGKVTKIQVADWNAGQLVVGQSKCLVDGLEIKNVGTETLVVTGFEWDPADSAFTITGPTDPPLPFSIAPGKSVKLLLVCFKALKENSNATATLKVKSNAASGDNLGILNGKSVQPGPQISSVNWGRRRVLDPSVQNYYPGYAVITNAGTSSIKLREVKLMLNATTQYVGEDYRIIDVKSVNTNDELVPGGAIEIFPNVDTNPTHCNSVRVNFLYTPRSEAAEKKIEVHANFDAIPQGTVVGYLQGEPYLPKIEATGYKFDPSVSVGFQHEDEGVITIQSTSQTADLFIKEIRIVDDIASGLNSSADFDINGELTAELMKYKNYTLPMGDVISIPVHFKPTRTGKRAIHLEIESDAYKALDSIQTTSVLIEGRGYDEPFEATDVKFDRITRCESPVNTFIVRNIGPVNKLKVLNMKVDDANKDIFIIEDFKADEEIDPLTERTYHVRFNPTARPDQIHDNNVNITAKITIETPIGSKTIDIEGRSVKSLVKLTQPVITDMLPGMTTTPQYKEFPVMIDLVNDDSHSGDWYDTKITSFSIDINYDPIWMKYNGSVTPGNTINGWTLTGTETIHNETSATLTVNGFGNTPISGIGKLFNPVFMILLSDYDKFSPQFGEISFGDRDTCVESINEPGSIVFLSVKDWADDQFSIKPISPNPVVSGSLDVYFNIGLDNVHTKVELVNSIGEVVSILSEGEMSGTYQATISTNELSPGVYFINMISGGKSVSEKFVVVR